MSFEDFGEYKKQGEASQKQKAQNWAIAIGLQQVDGITPSKYLIETAKENIEGKIGYQEVKQRIYSYYKSSKGKAESAGNEEADKVSLQIAEILEDESFTFSPATLCSIHRKLFSDIYPEIAGKIRDYNITKKEAVLLKDTVRYASALDIKETLEYDFEKEKNFKYKGLSELQKVERIAEFISGIWQIHPRDGTGTKSAFNSVSTDRFAKANSSFSYDNKPQLQHFYPFGEGNTRTIAVFTIKYLRTMGFEVNNEYFERNAKYFRDSLVRANYQNLKNDITYTKKHLLDFFYNLLLGATHILDSKNLIIDVGVNDTYVGVNVGVNAMILELLKENPSFTAKDLSLKLDKSQRTIERALSKLKQEGKLARIGSDKSGQWQVL